jgi:phage shock protein A
METNFDVITSSVRNKIRTLITLYEQHKTRNRELESKNKELLNKVAFLEKKLTDTEEKYNNIKLAKTIISVEDNANDAKIKMNRIVREIDKCIALLNR